MARKGARLGELLIRAGIISPFQLESALSRQRQFGGERLGASLVKLGYVSEEKLLQFLSDQYGLPRVDLKVLNVAPAVRILIPPDKAWEYGIIPVTREDAADATYLTVAMADPTNARVINALEFLTGCRIRPAVAFEAAILKALERWYGPAPEGVDPLRPGETFLEDIEILDEDQVEPLFSSSWERSTEQRLSRLLEILAQKGILSSSDLRSLFEE